MLIKFSIENYKSIYDKIDLDFRIKVYDANIKEIDNNPFVLKINEDYISKICLFYGHNGSGKTNIFEALFNLCLCNLYNPILKKLYEPNGIYGKNKESKFAIQFYSNKIDGSTKYSLFEYKIYIKNEYIGNKNTIKNNIQITYEILQKDNDTVFERKYNELITNNITNNNEPITPTNPEKYYWYKNQKIPHNKTVLSFLSSIYTEKDTDFDKISKYLDLFKLLPSSVSSLKSLSKPDFIGKFSDEIYSKLHRLKILNFYIELIKIADIGIDTMAFETREDDKEKLIKIYELLEKDSYTQEMSKDKKDEIKLLLKILKKNIENSSDSNRKQIYTYRNKWSRQFKEVESDGTKMYASHMYSVAVSIKEGCLSLHDEFYGVQSDLIKIVFLLFDKNRYIDEGIEQTSQLFMTTHDIELMNFKYLLLEQIKFVVKEENKTYIYSASDIDGLTKENIAEYYRKNKIGAKYFPRAYNIPIIMSEDIKRK